ncbi:hypothetical protein B0H65DRAFT_467756 [Neurospora tetraspora]|uniref:Uncharacterized protein n=1 Tax=Neurospora tetraspora TaxID=94610 RepID=A0AAE0JCD5_9PEZI|nr:hypothetical protein B0H65DRAFT_467756 [Neurospora tetraspora]
MAPRRTQASQPPADRGASSSAAREKDPNDDWINQNMPIIGGLDLLSLLRRRSLTFLVNKAEQSVQFGKVEMPAPFRYPFDYPFSESQSFNRV